MSTVDTPVEPQSEAPQPPPVKVTIYHNDEARFTPYEDGQLLNAITSHGHDTTAGGDPLAIAEWAFRTFNADLDMLDTQRHHPGGETTFLAAYVYRLLGHRSLSAGDVVEIRTEASSQWLACDPVGWRQITEPFTTIGEPLSAATVYQHLADQRSTR